ncbi:MAG: DUF4375 domain-containing protein [Verrucomicrobia bacterium]|nr:DUF4375 domain-containing protein [Verrucomicrobiota bacterium]
MAPTQFAKVIGLISVLVVGCKSTTTIITKTMQLPGTSSNEKSEAELLELNKKSGNDLSMDEILSFIPKYPGTVALKVRERFDERVRYDDQKSAWDLSALSEHERIIWRLNKFESEIGNGGLHQFFLNRGWESAQIAEDLFAVECASVAEWFRKATAVFPDGMLPPEPEQAHQVFFAFEDRAPIRKRWNKLDSQYYRELEGRLSESMANYILIHKDSFR